MYKFLVKTCWGTKRKHPSAMCAVQAYADDCLLTDMCIVLLQWPDTAGGPGHNWHTRAIWAKELRASCSGAGGPPGGGGASHPVLYLLYTSA
jgi:hypothetical protein